MEQFNIYHDDQENMPPPGHQAVKQQRHANQPQPQRQNSDVEHRRDRSDLDRAAAALPAFMAKHQMPGGRPPLVTRPALGEISLNTGVRQSTSRSRSGKSSASNASNAAASACSSTSSTFTNPGQIRESSLPSGASNSHESSSVFSIPGDSSAAAFRSAFSIGASRSSALSARQTNASFHIHTDSGGGAGADWDSNPGRLFKPASMGLSANASALGGSSRQSSNFRSRSSTNRQQVPQHFDKENCPPQLQFKESRNVAEDLRVPKEPVSNPVPILQDEDLDVPMNQESMDVSVVRDEDEDDYIEHLLAETVKVDYCNDVDFDDQENQPPAVTAMESTVSEDSTASRTPEWRVPPLSNDTVSIFSVPEYSEEIYEYLRRNELKHMPKWNYMAKQTDITHPMRSILIDWLVEVSEEYKLQTETLYLAVSYIDRFLSLMAVQRSKLQLVGTACMFIAAKYEEIYPPDVSEFVYITDDTYNKRQVLRMEHLVLKVLNFDLSVPTAHVFLNQMCELFKGESEEDDRIRCFALFLSELALVTGDRFLLFPPSLVAAACVALARHTLGVDAWPPTLAQATQYEFCELGECICALDAMHKAAATSPQQAVREKYKDDKYHNASGIDLNAGSA